MTQLEQVKKREIHITQLDEDVKQEYIRWLIDERIKELRSVFYPSDEELALIFEGRKLPPPDKILVSLSLGPGVDDQGAPGLGSALSLKLIVDALEPCDRKKVEVITFTANGYTVPQWVEKAGQYAVSYGLNWSTFDLTEINNAIIKTGLSCHDFTPLTMLRTIIPQLIDEHASFVVGYSSPSTKLFKILRASDDGNIAPVKYWDRSEMIVAAEYLGLERRIINQRPSNGALGDIEASRMMNRFFPNQKYSPTLASLLDYVLFLKDVGLDDGAIKINTHAWAQKHNIFTVDISSLVHEVSIRYDCYKDQLRVI